MVAAELRINFMNAEMCLLAFALYILQKQYIYIYIYMLCRQRDTFRLLVHEAILMKFLNPTRNRQDTGCARILKLYAANLPVKLDLLRIVCKIVIFL